jgi:hypothetical protein
VKLTLRAEAIMLELFELVDEFDKQCAALADRSLPTNKAIAIGFDRKMTESAIANAAWKLRNEVRSPSKPIHKPRQKRARSQSLSVPLVEIFGSEPKA